MFDTTFGFNSDFNQYELKIDGSKLDVTIEWLRKFGVRFNVTAFSRFILIEIIKASNTVISTLCAKFGKSEEKIKVDDVYIDAGTLYIYCYEQDKAAVSNIIHQHNGRIKYTALNDGERAFDIEGSLESLEAIAGYLVKSEAVAAVSAAVGEYEDEDEDEDYGEYLTKLERQIEQDLARV